MLTVSNLDQDLYRMKEILYERRPRIISATINGEKLNVEDTEVVPREILHIHQLDELRYLHRKISNLVSDIKL